MTIANHNPITGTPTTIQIENFFKKVGLDPTTGCHPWTAATNFHQDYPGDLTQAQGKFNYNGRTLTAYRFAMFLELGFQDPGPTVDHLCHNRICCNPLHLRCVPQIENNRTRRSVLSDFCRNGHRRTPENTGIRPDTGNRFCYVCTRTRDALRYKEKYAKEKAKQTNSSEMRDFASHPKLDESKVLEILEKFYNKGISGRSLAIEYQVSQPMIREIVNGRSWKQAYHLFKFSLPELNSPM